MVVFAGVAGIIDAIGSIVISCKKLNYEHDERMRSLMVDHEQTMRRLEIEHTKEKNRHEAIMKYLSLLETWITQLGKMIMDASCDGCKGLPGLF